VLFCGQDFENMEADTVAALATLTGELAGNYYPLAKMDAKTQEQLIQDHFLFRNDDEWVFHLTQMWCKQASGVC